MCKGTEFLPQTMNSVWIKSVWSKNCKLSCKIVENFANNFLKDRTINKCDKVSTVFAWATKKYKWVSVVKSETKTSTLQSRTSLEHCLDLCEISTFEISQGNNNWFKRYFTGEERFLFVKVAKKLI